MDSCWLMLATDAGLHLAWPESPLGIGWPLVFGSLCFMNIWLMVYAVHLGSQRGQGVYFWMFLTLLFGPFAILALWRQPVLRTCSGCGGESTVVDGAGCPYCGRAFQPGVDGVEAQPRVPQDWDDDGLTQ